MINIKLFFISITLATFLIGCTTFVPPVPAYKLKENGNVGLLVVAKSNPTHTHVGTTIFNNDVKEYDYDWNMQQTIFGQFKETIEQNSNYKVVDLKTIGYKDSDPSSFVTIKDKQWIFDPSNTAFRENLLENNIDIIVIIKEGQTLASLECSQYGCNRFHSEGYGLFTRSFFGLDRYHASKSFSMSIQTLDTPINLLLTNGFKETQELTEKSKLMSDFEDPKDFKNITKEELEPIRLNIIEYFKNLATLTRNFIDGDKLPTNK